MAYMKRISSLLFVAFIASTVQGLAQEKIVPEEAIFVDSTGRIYINKNLPIYVRISTSPEEGAESYLLQSESTADYANPMYLDTEGINTFRSPSAIDKETKEYVYPLRDVVFEVYSDSKAPVTKPDYGNVLTVFKDGKVYCGGRTKLTLEASDATSGVEAIYYSMDGGAFTEYSGPLPLENEKEYTVKFYSVDKVGNAEEPKERFIIVDASNPATKLEIIGDEYQNMISGRSSIKLVAADKHGIKAIYYTLDDQPERLYRGLLSAAYMNPGEHSMTYYSIDNLGNKEDVKSYDFYVDKTPPRIVEEILGSVFVANGREYSSGRSKLKLTTIDNKSGIKEVYYSINGGEYQLYEKPFFLSNNSGNLIIKSYAVDNVGNRSNSMQNSDGAGIPYIDLSGPILKHGFNGPLFSLKDTVYISEKTTISLQARDYEAGVKKIDYIIDDKESATYEQPFSVKKEGHHSIQFMGYDNVENSNKSSFTFILDNTGPEVFHRFSVVSEISKREGLKKYDVYPEHVVLFISATDQFAGYDKMFYSLNGGQEQPCYGQIKDFRPGKTYDVKIRALDKLGNSNEYSFGFAIE